MRFEFATATRIIFGEGTRRDIAPLAAQMGRHALVVTGNTLARAAVLIEQLQEAGVATTTFSVAKEPTTERIMAGTTQARQAGCDLVLGIGGGSVLDAGKAIAALLTNRGDLFDYLEVIGRGRPLTEPAAPTIAVPTTAGTGSEVTRNAVLSSPEHRVKVSLRSPLMLPDLAVVDPALTYSMPPAVTAGTGLDALTQVMEPYVSHLANPLTDGLCREGMQRVARSLARVYEEDRNSTARTDMALASLFGGLALANAKLGAVHGFAGPIGGMFDAPHGMICARLLPFVMEANMRALQERAADSPALAHYNEIGQLLTGDTDARAVDGVAWVQDVCERLHVPPLSAFGVTRDAIPALVTRSKKASSMKGNPIALTDEELTHVLTQAV